MAAQQNPNAPVSDETSTLPHDQNKEKSALDDISGGIAGTAQQPSEMTLASSPNSTQGPNASEPLDLNRTENAPATVNPSSLQKEAMLNAINQVPVRVSAVLGKARIDVASLMTLSEGAIVELDRKVGEPIDIYANDRLIARGELVLVDGALGVTLTEIAQENGA